MRKCDQIIRRKQINGLEMNAIDADNGSSGRHPLTTLLKITTTKNYYSIAVSINLLFAARRRPLCECQ